MFLIFLLIWIAALIYLQIRDNHYLVGDNIDTDEETEKPSSPKHEMFDRIVRLYIFVFGVVILFKVFYFLIQFFNSLYIGE